MTRFVVPIVTALTLLGSGLVHGYLSDRWSDRAGELVRQARLRVDAIPERIANWDGVPLRLSEFERDAGDDKLVTRQYTNRLNGSNVSVLVSAGYSRNIWQWHTPLQCYPASGYELVTPVTKKSVAIDGIDAEFFHADFTLPRGAAPVHLRVFWAFSGDGRWLAPDVPKLAFGQFHCLYKVYAIRTLLRPDEPLDNDPCLDFLKVSIPRLNETFFPPS